MGMSKAEFVGKAAELIDDCQFKKMSSSDSLNGLAHLRRFIPGQRIAEDEYVDLVFPIISRFAEDISNWNGDYDGPYDRACERMSGSLGKLYDQVSKTSPANRE